jgi:hypothetical protein
MILPQRQGCNPSKWISAPRRLNQIYKKDKGLAEIDQPPQVQTDEAIF